MSCDPKCSSQPCPLLARACWLGSVALGLEAFKEEREADETSSHVACDKGGRVGSAEHSDRSFANA